MNPAPGLIVDAHPGWTEEVASLLPGAHVGVLADDAMVGIEGRLAGLHLRDTILVLRAGPRTGFVFLFRKPLTEGTVAEQVIATGTGGINIDACRVGTTGGTRRSGQVAYPKRTDGREDRSKSWARTGHEVVAIDAGRWPANVVLVGSPIEDSRFSMFRDDDELRAWIRRLLADPRP